MDLLDRVKELQKRQKENDLICVDLKLEKRELSTIKIALDTLYAYDKSLDEELELRRESSKM